jgi:hypothetical protein
MNDFAATNAEPGHETVPIGTASPKSVPRASVMISSSELP